MTRIWHASQLYLFWPILVGPISVSINELTSWIGSFMAALIAFWVTSWLNWSWHYMLIVSFAIWYERIQAMHAPAPLCVYWRAHAASTVQFPRSFDSRLMLKWSWSARLKRLQFDVLVKTFCDWKNALLVKKKETELAVMSGVANTRLCPCVNGVK